MANLPLAYLNDIVGYSIRKRKITLRRVGIVIIYRIQLRVFAINYFE